MQKRRSIVILALCLILCISLCSINVLASPSNEPYITRVQVGNGNIIEIQNGLYEYQAVVPDSSVITSFSVTKNDGIDLTGIFMNGYTSFLYKSDANLIHLGVSSQASTNSVSSKSVNPVAKNLAETMIMIHIIPNTTNLIHSFIVFSSSDVIILYHPMNATAIHTTINISII